MTLRVLGGASSSQPPGSGRRRWDALSSVTCRSFTDRSVGPEVLSLYASRRAINPTLSANGDGLTCRRYHRGNESPADLPDGSARHRPTALWRSRDAYRVQLGHRASGDCDGTAWPSEPESRRSCRVCSPDTVPTAVESLLRSAVRAAPAHSDSATVPRSPSFVRSTWVLQPHAGAWDDP